MLVNLYILFSNFESANNVLVFFSAKKFNYFLLLKAELDLMLRFVMLKIIDKINFMLIEKI